MVFYFLSYKVMHGVKFFFGTRILLYKLERRKKNRINSLYKNPNKRKLNVPKLCNVDRKEK